MTESLIYLLFSLEGFVQEVKSFVKGGEGTYQGLPMRFYQANFEQNILFGPFQLYELSSYCEI